MIGCKGETKDPKATIVSQWLHVRVIQTDSRAVVELLIYIFALLFLYRLLVYERLSRGN